MTNPGGTTHQQRILWGCALFVGFVLIYYAHAPAVPVVAGCLLVIGVSALRTRRSGK
jgi:hypothetical protein